MKVQCPGCKSIYNLKEEIIPDTGVRIKCPKCQRIITVAKPGITKATPVATPAKNMRPGAGNKKSEFRQPPKRKVPKVWAIMPAIAIGIAALFFTLGIPTKSEKKGPINDPSQIEMPFNFTDDKFAEFKHFTEAIGQNWRLHPANFLNSPEYPVPDDYGHSQYGIEEDDIFVEFFFFLNQLYQATINIQDSSEAERWVEYLDNKFGEKIAQDKFYTWRNDDVNIVYVFEFEQYKFHFIHMETFAERKTYRSQFGSKLVKLEVFNKIIDNEMDWAATPNNFPDMTLHQKADIYKWSEYSDNNAANLYYKFFQDSLCRVDILVSDYELATKMHGILESRFGQGEINPDESINWIENGITITAFNYLNGLAFAFTHNETLKAKEEYAEISKPPQKKLALKEKRKKEAIVSNDSDGPRQTRRNERVEDSIRRIAGQNIQEDRRKKVSVKPREPKTRERSGASGVGSCRNNCYSQRNQCLYHCDQVRRNNLGPREKMYKGHVRSCTEVCYDANRDCLERCNG